MNGTAFPWPGKRIQLQRKDQAPQRKGLPRAIPNRRKPRTGNLGPEDTATIKSFQKEIAELTRTIDKINSKRP